MKEILGGDEERWGKWVVHRCERKDTNKTYKKVEADMCLKSLKTPVKSVRVCDY